MLAFFAILLATPFSFAYDLAAIYLQKTKVNPESAKQNCRLLTFQVVMTIIWVYLVFQTIYMIAHGLKDGGIGLVFATFFFAFILDQIK